MKDSPPLRLKIFFWLILGAFSTVFAEVVSGSDLFPFFNLWGIAVVFPIYTLHILVLGGIVFRYGKPAFFALFPAGMIFGLYEAYITKVLWNPAGNPEIMYLGGVAVVEFFVLVLFWHAIMAFIAPLAVSEYMLTRSRSVMNGMPDFVRKTFSERKGLKAIMLFALYIGVIQSVNASSFVESLYSGISNLLVMAFLVFLWRRTSGKEYDMAAMVPGRKAISVLVLLLLALYVILGAVIRPEALPGFGAQATIWMAYLVSFAVFALALVRSRGMDLSGHFRSDIKFSWKYVFAAGILFSLASAATSLLFPVLGLIVVTLSFILFGIIGTILFLLTLRGIVKKKA